MSNREKRAHVSEKTDRSSKDGCPELSRAAQTASRGLETSKDLLKLTLAAVEDVCTGKLSPRTASTVFQGVRQACQITALEMQFSKLHGNAPSIKMISGSPEKNSSKR